jgi:hypothetical protein
MLQRAAIPTDQIITLTGVMTPLSPAKAEFSVIWGCY